MKKLKPDTGAAVFLLVMSLVLFFVCLALASGSARADAVYLGGWSLHKSNHMDSGERYNETHYLVGYERNDILVAGFKNSYGDPTLLVSKGYELHNSEHIKFTIGPALVYGYRRCFSGDENANPRLCAAVVPKVEFNAGRIKPVIIYMGRAVAITFKVEI